MNKLLDELGGPLEYDELLPEAKNAEIQKAYEEAITQQIVVSREEIFNLAQHSPDVLAGLAIPEVAVSAFPPVFLAMWQLLLQSLKNIANYPKIALGIPRGFAKTTFMKVFLLFCILYTDIKFILVVAATAELHAANILSDVIRMLEHPNIRKIYGDWRTHVERDTREVKIFTFRGRRIILAAMGAGSALRGLNVDNARPEIILMDDMQTRENALSPTLSENLVEWMVGTLMKTKPPTGCLYIFVGNMYPSEGSILKKLKNNPTWTSFICGALLVDGESIWPELQSREQLIEEFKNDLAMGHPEIFMAEVLNDPEAGTRSGIDIRKIPLCPDYVEYSPPDAGFIIIDLASGKLSGNDVVIGCFLVHDGKPTLRKMKAGKLSPKETIEEALKFCFEYNIRVVAVESTSYQYTFLFWFTEVCTEKRIEGVELCELYRVRTSKNAAIKSMLQQLVRSELFLHGEVRSAVIYQIVHWNPLKQDNADDLLDVLAYAYKVMEQYGPLTEIIGHVYEQEVGAARALSLHEMNIAF